MPRLTRCPHCGHGKPVPDDFLGAKARCPKCRQKFRVVPEFDPDARRKPAADPTAVVEATTPTEPLPAAEPVDPSAALEPIFKDELPPAPISLDPQPVGVGGWVVTGLAGAAAVGAGVSAAVTSLAFLVIPLAAVGAVLGGVAVFAFAGRRRPWLELVIPAVTAAGSALLLLVAAFAPDALSPQYDAATQTSTYDPTAIEVVPAGGELIDPKTLGSPADGVDAGRAALQQGPVRVRVTGVTVGPLELDTAKPSATKERYLIVNVQIQHVGHGGQVSFVAWGSAVPKPVPDVRLTRGGKPVRETDLGSKAVRGKLYHEHALASPTVLTTRLVFELPPGPAEPLTLELPAEAWGRAGVFRFRIPAAMVPAVPKK